MKPPKFRVGQAVVCIKIGKARPGCAVVIEEGVVYVVEKTLPDDTPGDKKGWWISCREWAGQLWAHESLFAPAEPLSDAALAELLKEVFTPVTA